MLLINSNNINLCKRCKFFIPSVSQPLSKCKHFLRNKILRNKYYINTTDYEYCFLAREMEEMCGKNGKRFVEKVEKDLFVEKVLSDIWEP